MCTLRLETKPNTKVSSKEEFFDIYKLPYMADYSGAGKQIEGPSHSVLHIDLIV